MIRTRELQDSLAHLVGWRSGGTDTRQTTSGLYFEDAHPLLTEDNIRAMLADGRDYEGYLKEATATAIAEAANRLLADNTLSGAGKQLLGQSTLFDGAGRLNNRIARTGRIVGYAIDPLRGTGITTILHRIGTQFVGQGGDTFTLPLHIFCPSMQAPVATVQATCRRDGSVSWHAASATIPYRNPSNGNSGDRWYICYNEDDLPADVEAINVSIDFTRPPCGSCNKANATAWERRSRYIKVIPFSAQVPDGWADSPILPDPDTVQIAKTNTHGLNLDLSIGCDLTDLLIDQQAILAPVIQMQAAADVLRRIAFNPDVAVSRNQLNATRQDIILELDGNTYTRSSGLGGRLNKAYSAMQIDLGRLDTACASCTRKGVRHTIA